MGDLFRWTDYLADKTIDDGLTEKDVKESIFSFYDKEGSAIPSIENIEILEYGYCKAEPRGIILVVRWKQV
ncbi:MAG: hypothetical protein ABJG47_13085 [Ekhidna sp.]